MSTQRPVCIAGAGSIGCFVGGLLAAAGQTVSLLTRRRIVEGILAQGLRLSSFEGGAWQLSAQQIAASDDPAILADAGLILVTVKSGDTAAMAALIAQYAPPDAVIVSLQNGVGNVDVLKATLPGRLVLGGMVPFNVVTRADGTVRRATSGALVIARDAAGTAGRLAVPGLAVTPTDNIAGVQWGKLLINLSNALNALSDLPLREQLQQRAWRLLYADQMREGLMVLRAAGITPVSVTPIPVWLTPHLLRLPDRGFDMLLNRVMKIDADARSSMWEDLVRGRVTEIDYLQGMVLQLARRHGIAAPLCERVAQLIKTAERAGQGSPGLTPQDVRGV